MKVSKTFAAVLMLWLGCAPAWAQVIDPGRDGYKVTGQISGLAAGNNLVLQLNAANDKTVTTNGVFAMPGSVTTGDAYVVTVLHQPVAQSCSIANGSGTMPSHNVSNVWVTCTASSVTHTVTASVPGGHGSITPASQVVAANGTAGFTLTPAAHYHLLNVAGDTCTPEHAVGDDSHWTAADITADCTVTASFIIYNYNVTATAGPGGGISPAAQTIDYGGTASFTITPDAHHHEVSVSGDTCTPVHAAGAQWTASNITAWCAVQADFAIDTYTLTYAAGANGAISGVLSQTVAFGASGAAVRAVADVGYHFVQWSDGSTINPRTDSNVSANLNVTAGFAINTFTLGYGAVAHGVVWGDTLQTVSYGGDGTAVTAQGNVGYHFVKWSDGSTANPRTDSNVTANLTVLASFALDSHDVTASVVGGHGSITPASQSVDDGASASFTVTPETGYHVASVIGDTCTVIGADNGYSAADIQNDCAVTASFAVNSHRVGGSVTGLVSGNQVVLQINGAGDLSVSADGVFQFATMIDYAASYAVTVLTQPTTPDQICTVTDGSGTMADFAVTDVQVVCVTLAPSLSLMVSDGSDYARYGQVLDYQITLRNDGDGAAHAVAVSAIPGAAMDAVFDTDGATWQCTDTSGGATCTAAGAGVFNDTASLPAHSSVTWTASMPIKAGSLASAAQFEVQADGTDPQIDSDTLVLLRDGFDAPDAVDRSAATVIDGASAHALLAGDATAGVMVPVGPVLARSGKPFAPVHALLIVRGTNRGVRVDAKWMGGRAWLRLVTHDARGNERASAWNRAAPGATLVLGGVASQSVQSPSIILLEGAGVSLRLQLD